jgi:predicted  nucleic acid-binding Zn-ribbon protein
MRDSIVPAPDIHGLVVRERRLTVVTGAVVVALIAAAGGFVWSAIAALDDAQSRIVTAEAEVAAARADAEAARLGASSAIAELEEGRARFAAGEATVNRTENELLRTSTALSSVKEALRQSRNLVAFRTSERDSARGEVARLTAELTEARNAIAGLQGEVATARLQILGGLGRVAIAETWIASLRADFAYTDVRLAETEAVVTALKEHIGLSVALSKHLHPVDTEDAEKLADSSDRLSRLLSRVLDMQEQNTRFSSANKPSVGFNSPGFTGYVLGRVVRGKSLKSLPSTETPQLGDIIRYENGLDMFLLQDAEGVPFVIGMTPVGIAALEPDFGVPRSGALATGIFQQ